MEKKKIIEMKVSQPTKQQNKGVDRIQEGNSITL